MTPRINIHLADVSGGAPGVIILGTRVPTSDSAWQSNVVIKTLNEGTVVSIVTESVVTLSANGAAVSVAAPDVLS